MIKINSLEVLTGASQQVGYELINPHLIYDSIPGSTATLPSFPAVRINRAVFGYFEEPQSGSESTEYLFQQFWNGELIREGFLLLTEASLEGGYKGTYTDKLGLFFGEYQNLSLRELDLGTLTMPAPLTPTLGDIDGLACAFPTIVDDAFFGTNGGAVGYTGRINDYAGSAYRSGPKVPQFFAGWVLKKIGALTGIAISGDFFSHPQWSQLLLVNLREAETSTIEVRNHLPDLSLVGFLLELRKIPNLRLTLDPVGRSLRVDFWEADLAAPVARDWTAKAVVGQVKKTEPNTRISLSMALDGNDALAKDRPAALADYLSPETGSRGGIAKLPLSFSTMLVDEASGLAACRQEGQTSQFGQESKTWAPRLLFWHGKTDGLPRALPSMAELSLFPAALAATSWRETIALRARMFYLQKELTLNETDLAKLDFSKKYHIEGMDYLIAQLSVTVPIRGVTTALLIGGV